MNCPYYQAFDVYLAQSKAAIKCKYIYYNYPRKEADHIHDNFCRANYKDCIRYKDHMMIGDKL